MQGQQIQDMPIMADGSAAQHWMGWGPGLTLTRRAQGQAAGFPTLSYAQF